MNKKTINKVILKYQFLIVKKDNYLWIVYLGAESK